MYKCTVSLSSDDDKGPCPWKVENSAENDDCLPVKRFQLDFF